MSLAKLSGCTNETELLRVGYPVIIVLMKIS